MKTPKEIKEDEKKKGFENYLSENPKRFGFGFKKKTPKEIKEELEREIEIIKLGCSQPLYYEYDWIKKSDRKDPPVCGVDKLINTYTRKQEDICNHCQEKLEPFLLRLQQHEETLKAERQRIKDKIEIYFNKCLINKKIPKFEELIKELEVEE